MQELHQLYQSVKDGNLIVFIGSGITRNLLNDRKENLPTWSGLIDDIVKFAQLELPKGLKLQEKLEKIDEFLIENKQIKTEFKSKFLKQRYNVTADNFENQGVRDVFELIDKISNGRIITTNYDDAFEKYYYSIVEKLDINVYIPSNLNELNEKTALTNRKKFIAKIHGNADESAVVFASDYKELYQFPENASKENLNVKEFLNNSIQNFPILFLGYSLSDDEINRITTNITNKFPNKNRTYFVIGTDNFLKNKENVHFIEVPEDKSERLKPIIAKLNNIYQEVFKSQNQTDVKFLSLIEINLKNPNIGKDEIFTIIDLLIDKVENSDFYKIPKSLGVLNNAIRLIRNESISTDEIGKLTRLRDKISKVSEYVSVFEKLDFIIFRIEFENFINILLVDEDTSDFHTAQENLNNIFSYRSRIIDIQSQRVENHTEQASQLSAVVDKYNKCIKTINQKFIKNLSIPDGKEKNNYEESFKEYLNSFNLKKIAQKYNIQFIDDDETIGSVILRKDRDLEAFDTINKTAEFRFYLLKIHNQITGFIDLNYIKKCANPSNYHIRISKENFTFPIDWKISDIKDVLMFSFTDVLKYFVSEKISTSFEQYTGGGLKSPNSILSPFVFFNPELSISYKSIFAEINEKGHSLFANTQISDLKEIYSKNVTRNKLTGDAFSSLYSLKFYDYPLFLKQGVQDIGYITYYHYLSRSFLANLYGINNTNNTIQDTKGFSDLPKGREFFKETKSLKEVIKYFADSSKEDFIIVEDINKKIQVLFYWDVFRYFLTKI